MGSKAEVFKYSEAVSMGLRPSRRARGFVRGAVVATVLLVVALPFPPLAGVGVLAWASLAYRRALASICPVCRLELDRQGRLRLLGPEGRWREGEVQAGSFVAPWLTVLHWRPAGAWFDRTVVVMPDAVDGDDFRRLRVLLKFPRSARAGKAGPSSLRSSG